MRREISPKLAAVIIVLVVAVVAGFIWKRTAGRPLSLNNRPGTLFEAVSKDEKSREMVRKRWMELNGQNASGPVPAQQPANQGH